MSAPRARRTPRRARAARAACAAARSSCVEDGRARDASARAAPAAPPLHARIEVHDRRPSTRALLRGGAGARRAPTWTACGTATTSSRWCGSRRARCPRSTAGASGCCRSIGAVAARRLAAAREHARARARADRRPLRPRQRALRALPRRDDDVLVRRSSSGRDATLHEASAREARRASAASSTSRPATTCWRSAPAGAASRCTRPARYGCRVTTTTISREQHDHARARVRAAGLEDRVTVLLRGLPRPARQLRQARLDRDDRGGRLGALRHLLRAPAASCSSPTARCCCRRSSIGDRAYRVEKASTGFINAFIFPGGACRRWRRSSARSRAAPTCARSRSRTSRRTTRARCAAGASASTRALAGAARARLRRALPPHVGPLPRLLRGRLRASAASRDVQLLLAKPALPRRAGRAAAGAHAGRITAGRGSRPRTVGLALAIEDRRRQHGHVLVLVDDDDGVAPSRDASSIIALGSDQIRRRRKRLVVGEARLRTAPPGLDLGVDTRGALPRPASEQVGLTVAIARSSSRVGLDQVDGVVDRLAGSSMVEDHSRALSRPSNE